MPRRRWLARSGVAGLVLLAACTNQPPSVAPGSAASSVPTAGGATASVRPSASVAKLATPGTPYEAADVLAAMLDSRRPGGIPDELKTESVAAALAAELWTWDGEPWASWTVGGACGPQACSLDVAGSSAAGAGTDLYSFVVERGSGAVTLAGTDLHGYPQDLETTLDAIARRALEPADLTGLSLVAARWLPPPQTDRYWLAYRSGGEEGAPRLDVLVDLATGEAAVLEAENSS